MSEVCENRKGVSRVSRCHVIMKYSHLNGVKIAVEDTKKELPVQIILREIDNSRIKFQQEHVQEILLNRLPSTQNWDVGILVTTLKMMSSGKMGEHESMMLTQITMEDYSQLFVSCIRRAWP